MRTDVRALFSMDFTCFVSILIICTIRFCWVHQSTIVNQLVHYSLFLIYKGIGLYSRVTNLGLEGKQTLQQRKVPSPQMPPTHLAQYKLGGTDGAVGELHKSLETVQTSLCSFLALREIVHRPTVARPSRVMPADVASARLRCGHNGCEGQGTDEHYCVGPDGRLASWTIASGSGPCLHTQVLACIRVDFIHCCLGGGDQTEQECTTSTSGPYGRREAQCGICAHLWQACDYGGSWRKWEADSGPDCIW
jgi:hypothetical protein